MTVRGSARTNGQVVRRRLLEPSGASIADDTGVAWIDDANQDGWFVCRALPLTDPRCPRRTSSFPTDCISQQHSSASVPVGDIGTISLAATREVAQPSSPNVAPLAVGDGGRAEASSAG